MDPLSPHPTFGPSVETVDIIHIPRGYERRCDSHLESFWGHQGRLPSRSESSWREQVGGSLGVLWWWWAELRCGELGGACMVWTPSWYQRKRRPACLMSLLRCGAEWSQILYCTLSVPNIARDILMLNLFVCLKFKFNWVSCVFIVAVKSSNPIYRAEKGKSLAASWDCSNTTPTLSHLLPDFLFFETNEPLFS